MKLGQMASYLDDGLSQPVRDALAGLQQDAPPMAPELSAQIVREQLGDAPDRVFAAVGPGPDRGRVDRAGAPRGHALRPPRRGEGPVPGHRRRDPGRSREHRCRVPGARRAVSRIRTRAAGRGVADPARRRARLRHRGRQPAPVRGLVRRSSVHPCPARRRRALDRSGAHDRARVRRPLRRGRGLGPGSAQRGRRGHLPVRVPQHLPSPRVQRRPPPRQLPVPARRARHLPRLRPRQAVHAERGLDVPDDDRGLRRRPRRSAVSAARSRTTTC